MTLYNFNFYFRIQDVNDNKPEFIFDERHEDKSYLVTISKTTSPNTGIIQIKAEDKDAGDFGELAFRLTDESGFFAIDAKTGIVRTTANFGIVESEKLPLNYWLQRLIIRVEQIMNKIVKQRNYSSI